jgi:rhodanese-related sulfurtransferase
MKISYKNILIIISVSILVGLMYNNYNPKGIPLVEEKKELVFESDSLIFSFNDEVKITPTDSISNKSEKIIAEKEKEIKQENKESKEAPAIKIEPFSEPRAIKIDLAYKLFKQGIKFIDARMPDEYAAGHIKGAYNIPFDGDESYREILNKFSKEEIIVVYCGGTDCDLSIYLGNELFEKGFKRVYVFFGGWNEWLENNYPTSRN